MPDLAKLTAKLPRLFWCGLIALLIFCALALIAPQQVPVMLYKVCLVLASGYLGYLLDHWVFPMGQPGGYLSTPWQDALGFKSGQADHTVALGCEALFIAACYRRALIIVGAMLAVGLGL